jgi:hypothetical protein
LSATLLRRLLSRSLVVPGRPPKDEFVAMQTRQAQDMDAFFSRITEQRAATGCSCWAPST